MIFPLEILSKYHVSQNKTETKNKGDIHIQKGDTHTNPDFLVSQTESPSRVIEGVVAHECDGELICLAEVIFRQVSSSNVLAEKPFFI